MHKNASAHAIAQRNSIISVAVDNLGRGSSLTIGDEACFQKAISDRDL
jgi:hypothetical protein